MVGTHIAIGGENGKRHTRKWIRGGNVIGGGGGGKTEGTCVWKNMTMGRTINKNNPDRKGNQNLQYPLESRMRAAREPHKSRIRATREPHRSRMRSEREHHESRDDSLLRAA